MATIQVDIVSAEGEIYSGDAAMVYAPARMGDVTQSSRLLTEGLIPLSEVPKIIGADENGRRLHRSAPWRWVSKGVKGPDGDPVRLEAVKNGRGWCTSQAAVARFLAAQTPAPRRSEPSRAPASLRRKTLEILAKHGLAGHGRGADSGE